MRREGQNFTSPKSIRTGLGPTQPPVQCMLGVLTSGVNGPGNDSSPPSTDVKNVLSCISLSQDAFSAYCLIKHRNHFIVIKKYLLPLSYTINN